MTSIHRTSGALVVAPALLTAALLTACGGTDGDSAATTSSSQSSTTGDTSTSAGSTASDSSASGSSSPAGQRSESVDAALAALRTAADAVPDGRPFDLERDTYQGEDVWEIKVASNGDEFELYVSADGRTVLQQGQDNSPGDDVQKVQRAQIEATDALQTAADANQGLELDELEIDTRRDGTLVWEVEFLDGGFETGVYVDANTGEIIG